ncbi:hypothetical protein Mapa_001053 [Marchantia paleacea]|nr:hypothetical protein Mapa_001053 [Marchantia paleacea]
MLVEVGQSGNRIHHICRLVHYHNDSSSKTSLHCFQRIQIHEDIITHMLGKEGTYDPPRITTSKLSQPLLLRHSAFQLALSMICSFPPPQCKACSRV